MAKNDPGDVVSREDRAKRHREAGTAADPRPLAALRFGFGCHVVDAKHDGSSWPVRMIASEIWSLREEILPNAYSDLREVVGSARGSSYKEFLRTCGKGTYGSTSLAKCIYQLSCTSFD